MGQDMNLRKEADEIIEEVLLSVQAVVYVFYTEPLP